MITLFLRESKIRKGGAVVKRIVMYKYINIQNVFPALLALVITFILFASIVGGVPFWGNKLTRVNKQGVVDVSATYLEPKNMSTPQVSFSLKINTHAVDLYRYDFERISFVQFDDSEPMPYGIWDSSGSSPHFRGILTFEQSIPADARRMRLLIKNLDGVDERVFEWDLPIGRIVQEG